MVTFKSGAVPERETEAPDLNLTVKLITHCFTEGSRDVLQGVYSGSTLGLNEAARTRMMTRFGSAEYVVPHGRVADLHMAPEGSVNRHPPQARVLYWA